LSLSWWSRSILFYSHCIFPPSYCKSIITFLQI